MVFAEDICPQHCRVDFAKDTITIPKAPSFSAVHHRRFAGTLKSLTISMTPSGENFATVLVDANLQELPLVEKENNTTIGINLGIKSLVVCSDGCTFDNPKLLHRSLERLAVLQKRLRRK